MIGAQPPISGDKVRYREEIRHPSMTSPAVAQGWFEQAKDGRLVRHQTEPQVETVEIGHNYIRLSRESDGYQNIVPIPSDMTTYLQVLRPLVTDDRAGLSELLAGYDSQIVNGAAGWEVSLSANGGGSARLRMLLAGCGEILQSIEWQLTDGTRRRYVFASSP